MDMRLLTRRWIMSQFRMVPFLAILYFFSQTPDASAQFSEAGVGKFKAPAEAPAFTLRELGGREVSLKELKGKVIILNFFGTR